MKKILNILLFVAVTLFVVSCSQDSSNDLKSNIETPDYVDTESDEVEDNDVPNNEQVSDEDACIDQVKFDFSPVNLEKTKVFLPLGLMTGSHVTPIDHHYFQNFENVGYNIEVYSPGDGVITQVQHMPGHPDGEDYRVVIDHGCGVSSIYIHLGLFADKFTDIAPELFGKDYLSVNVEIQAGELLGYYERNVDYNIVDMNFELTGFIDPLKYSDEEWKTHIPDTYLYFNEPIKSQLLEKSLRSAEPISGKIDYDVPGRLVGNWFLEGTNGYGGPGIADEGYWMGHLAIAYDPFDPEGIIFSIGGYMGEDSRQFAVKGNSPDPKDVSADSGIIKYELVDYTYKDEDGNYWDRISLATGINLEGLEFTYAVLLVKVLDGERIMFETFNDGAVEDISNFTENAKIYER